MRIGVMALVVVIAGASAARLEVQAGSATPAAPTWEALVRVPLAADAEPVISVNGLTMPADPVAEHSHPGQTIGYITAGEIENQVLPDSPANFKPGGRFYEAPRQVHKMMRNLGADPAKLLISPLINDSPLMGPHKFC
jgi:hypothetical protein